MRAWAHLVEASLEDSKGSTSGDGVHDRVAAICGSTDHREGHARAKRSGDTGRTGTWEKRRHEGWRGTRRESASQRKPECHNACCKASGALPGKILSPPLPVIMFPRIMSFHTVSKELSTEQFSLVADEFLHLF